MRVLGDVGMYTSIHLASHDEAKEKAMPNKVKFVSEDMSTFFDKCVPAYAAPGEVTEGDRPLDREYWDREVRD